MAPGATASLVMGILALATLVFGVVFAALALVLGYRSKRLIAASGGQLGGASRAKAGRVMGWVWVGLIPLTIVMAGAMYALVGNLADAGSQEDPSVPHQEGCGLPVPDREGSAIVLPAWEPPEGATPDEGSYIYFHGTPGDYIMGGNNYLYNIPEDATLDIQALGLTFRYPEAGGVADDRPLWWTGRINLPSGCQEWSPAYVEGMTRAAFADPETGGIDFSGDGRGCNNIVGSLIVDYAHYDAEHTLDRLVLRFEQHCEGEGRAPLMGKIVWEAPRSEVDANEEGPRLSYTFDSHETDGVGGDLTITAWGGPQDEPWSRFEVLLNDDAGRGETCPAPTGMVSVGSTIHCDDARDGDELVIVYRPTGTIALRHEF